MLLNITKISHIEWSKRSTKNCHGIKLWFSTDFDLNKSNSISLVVWIKDEFEEGNETYTCQNVAQRQGVCISSFSERKVNRKKMYLLFYLNQSHEVRFSMFDNKSFSYLTVTPETSINGTETTANGTSPSPYDDRRSTNGIRSPINTSSLKVNTQKLLFTSALLKKRRYEFRYEGEMIKLGNLSW